MRATVLLALAALLAACGTTRPSPARPRTAPHTTAPGRRQHPPPHRTPSTRPVPILEYHVIGDPAAGTPNTQLWVAPTAFRDQLAWLAAHGFTGVTLDRVLAAWRVGAPLPPHPVVLTFDDGYPSDWQIALPVLRAHRWPGTLNLQVGNLVPLHVRQLVAAGWEIDAHTFTHPDLTTVGPTQLAHEIDGSRLWIHRVFGVPVDAFAYPAGREDAAVVAEVRRAGYLAGETEVRGWASPADGLLTLDRLEITRDTSLPGFAQALAHSFG